MQQLQPNTTLQGGKYRIERVLGQGGFGITYLARNTVFDVNVAIKEFFLKDENGRDGSMVTIPHATKTELFLGQKEKFKKEAKRMFAIKNEHIVAVHDLFEENGTAYYVMDYVDGENLSDRLKRTGRPMSEVEVREVLPQILDALKTVHNTSIWHLDLKPSNIMVDKKGKVYVIDFGASKQVRANGSITTSTALCYTPGFAPNEQIGQLFDRFGPWTDLYALGATIYNLLSNKKPPMSIDIEEDEEDAFNFLDSTSEDMRKLVVWMMQPQRKARPQNVDGLIEKLDTKRSEWERTNEKTNPVLKPEPALESESEKTFFFSESEDTQKTNQRKSNEVEQTILVVSKTNQQPVPHFNPHNALPQRAIKVGDFIYDDGSYSERMENGRTQVGVLFSYFGGAHGQILSAVKPYENMSINGRELKWHEASVAEWVEVIQNLGHCKVSFASWEYHFYSVNVQSILAGYHVKEKKYATRKSVSGVVYEVNLEKCKMTPVDDPNKLLPHIYISEF